MSLGTVNEGLRLFVALQPAPHLVGPLTELIARLQRSLPERAVRWVRPDQLHLTLLFLGRVAGERVTGLRAQLAAAAGAHPALHLALRTVGTFPNARRPRVVWIGIEGDARGLNRLQADVAAAGAPFVERPEARAFHPHLTLGRVNSDNPCRATLAAAALGAFGPVTPGDWEADELLLIRSELCPTGSVYTQVDGWKLGGSGPPTA